MRTCPLPHKIPTIWDISDKSESKFSDGTKLCKPLPLREDGNLVAYIQCILEKRVMSTMSTEKVAKVKGHATDEMVADGSVRWQDKDGNEAADRVADSGRRRQLEHVMDARRRIQMLQVFGALSFSICTVFFIAVARTVVNHGGKGGSAPDPLSYGPVVV